MEKTIAIILAIVSIFVIDWPARLLGKRMHEVGLKEQRKWKIDLGAAIYTHGFRLTIAIVVLFTVLIPRMLGVNIFS
jgi:hypothetical protein